MLLQLTGFAVVWLALTFAVSAAPLDYRLSHGIGSLCAISRYTATCDNGIQVCFNCPPIGGGTVCPDPTPLAQSGEFRCNIPVSGRWSLLNSTGVDVRRMRLDSRGQLAIFIAPTFKVPPINSGVGGPVEPQDFYRADIVEQIVAANVYYSSYVPPPGVGPTQTPDQLWAAAAELPEVVTLPVPHSAPTIRLPTTQEVENRIYTGEFSVDDAVTTKWASRLNLAQPTTFCNASVFFFLYKPVPMPSRVQPFESLQKKLIYEWRQPADYQLSAHGRVGNYVGAQRVQPQMPPSNAAVYTQDPIWPLAPVGGTSPVPCYYNLFGAQFPCTNRFRYDVTVGTGPDSGTDEPVMAQFLTMSWAKPGLVDCSGTGYCPPNQGEYSDNFVQQGILPQVDSTGWNSKGIYQDVGMGSPFVGTVSWHRHPACSDPYVNFVVPGAGNTNITAPVYMEWVSEESVTWTLRDYRGRLGRTLNVNGLNQEELSPRDPEALPLYTPERLQFFEPWCRVTAPSGGFNLSDPVQAARYLDLTGGIVQPALDTLTTNSIIHIHHVDGVPSDTYNMWVQQWSLPTVPVSPVSAIIPPGVPPTPNAFLLNSENKFGVTSAVNLIKNNEFRQFAVPFPDNSGTWSSDDGIMVSRRFNPYYPLRQEYDVAQAARPIPLCRCVYSDTEITQLGDVVCDDNVNRRPVPNTSVLRKPASIKGLSTPQKSCQLLFSDETPFSSYDSVFDVYRIEQNRVYTIDSIYTDGSTIKSSFNAPDLRFGWYLTSLTSHSVQLISAEQTGVSLNGSASNGIMISRDSVKFKALADLFGPFTLNLDIRSINTRVSTGCSLRIVVAESCSRSYVAYSTPRGATGATTDDSLETLKVTIEPNEVVQLETWIRSASSPSVSQISWSWNLLDAIPITSYSSAMLLENNQKRTRFFASQEGSYGLVAVVTQVGGTVALPVICTSVTLVEINVVNSSLPNTRLAAPPALNLTTSCLGTAGNFTGADTNSTRYVEADAPPPFNYVPVAEEIFPEDETFQFATLFSPGLMRALGFSLGPAQDEQLDTPVGSISVLTLAIILGSIVAGVLILWFLQGVGFFRAIWERLRTCTCQCGKGKKTQRRMSDPEPPTKYPQQIAPNTLLSNFSVE